MGKIFGRNQRRALLILEWIIVFVIIGMWVRTWWRPENQERQQQDSVFAKMNVSSSSSLQESYAVEEEPFASFSFDPNTADSTALLRLGLAPWQVRAVYRYRAKHGRYHNAEDFKRLPGMTGELWEHLRPLIVIDPKYQYVQVDKAHTVSSIPRNNSGKREVSSSADSSQQDSVFSAPTETMKQPERQEKLSEGEYVDIGTADTTELKKIPGIASYRASKIVEYRARLGGFVQVEQVMEACKMPDEVLDWMKLEQGAEVKKVDVNNLSLRQLMKHPYISFYQAKSITEYRLRHGALKSPDELRFLENFTPEGIERLIPYLEFK